MIGETTIDRDSASTSLLSDRDRTFRAASFAFPAHATLTQAKRAYILRCNRGSLQIELNLPGAGIPPSWMEPVFMNLGHLMDLAPNWNSYGAKEVTPEAAQEAIMVLSQLMSPHTPPPAVVPMASGGIQLEWHDKGVDLEIYIAAEGSVTISVEDIPNGIEWEGTLDSDGGEITRALKKLS